MSKNLPIEVSKELFMYDPEEGVLTWNPEIYSAKKCARNLGDNRSGMIQVDGRSYTILSIIWGLKTGELQGEKRLHFKDKNKKNIVWDNIGEGHHKTCAGESGIPGIQRPNRDSRLWRVRLSHDGMTHTAGTFGDLNEAITALNSLRANLGMESLDGVVAKPMKPVVLEDIYGTDDEDFGDDFLGGDDDSLKSEDSSPTAEEDDFLD